MGLYPKLTSTLVEKIASTAESPLPFICAPSTSVLSETSIVFVDLTQFLFIPTTLSMDGLSKVSVRYGTIQDFLSSNDPIGDLTYDKVNKCVTNTLDLFKADVTGKYLARRVETLVTRWKTACDIFGVSNHLRTLVLVTDGDSPRAKSETRRKRASRSSASCAVKNIQEWCEDEPTYKKLLNRTPELINRLYDRMFSECEAEDGSILTSVQRYMCNRKHRARLMLQMSDVLKKNTHIDMTVYVANGYTQTQPNQGSQVTRVCGKYIHVPPLPQTIDYLEADSIIPFLWSHVREQETGGLVHTSDSDMFVSLLSMYDQKIRLLCNATSKKFDNYIIFDKKFALQTNMGIDMSIHTHLACLLHMSMGGTDYVEKFDRLGVKGLIDSLYTLLGHKDLSDLPICTQLIKWGDLQNQLDNEENRCPGDIVTFDHFTTKVNSPSWIKMRQILLSDESIFPVRIKKDIVLVKIDHSKLKETIQWYRNYTTASRVTKESDINNKDTENFALAMRRRLFFLALMTECRSGLEIDMLTSPEISKKCGYDYHNQFSFTRV